MQTKGDLLLSNILRVYNNIVTLLRAYSEAGEKSTTVKILTEDDREIEVKVGSYREMQIELQKILKKFDSLINNRTFKLDSDGKIRTYQQTSLLNVDYLQNFHVGSECVINPNKDIIEDFAFPIVQVPIELNTLLNTYDKIQAVCCIVESGFENIKQDVTLIELDHLIKIGKVNASTYNRTLEIRKKQIEMFGTFDVISAEDNGKAGEYRIHLNTLFYGSRISLENNILLAEGDKLVSKDGQYSYVIKKVNTDIREVIVAFESQYTNETQNRNYRKSQRTA